MTLPPIVSASSVLCPPHLEFTAKTTSSLPSARFRSKRPVKRGTRLPDGKTTRPLQPLNLAITISIMSSFYAPSLPFTLLCLLSLQFSPPLLEKKQNSNVSPLPALPLSEWMLLTLQTCQSSISRGGGLTPTVGGSD